MFYNASSERIKDGFRGGRVEVRRLKGSTALPSYKFPLVGMSFITDETIEIASLI